MAFAKLSDSKKKCEGQSTAYFFLLFFCGALLKFTNAKREGQGRSHLQTPNPSPQQIAMDQLHAQKGRT